MEAYYRKYARCVDDLKFIVKLFWKFLVVEFEMFIVVFVGVLNVGKSLLVCVLFSGLSEVCNYSFTTKGIKMGYFFVDDE